MAVLTLGAAMLALSCGGCASASARASTNARTRIFVTSSKVTNDGKTLYMMVRRVDPKVATNEPYEDAAAKVFADPVDPTVVMTQPIFPGNTITVPIDDDAKDLIVYFLYTNPGPNWRLPLRAPLASEIRIDLGKNQIERVQARKR